MVEVTEQYIAEMKSKITAIQSQCTDVDSLLLPFAKEKDLYVDFSDKTYDGDKEAPMDRIGLLSYLISQCTEKEQEIERLSGLLVSLSNGEAMNVVKESEGVYSVIFKTPKAIL